MKPIIIYPDEKCDTVTMSREKFEKIIQETYEQGIKDAPPLIKNIPYQIRDFPKSVPLVIEYHDLTVTPKPLDITPIITC